MIKILGAEALRNACNDDLLALQKKADASNEQALIGQKRAEEALKLGLGIKADDFIWTVDTIDDGIEILTGVRAGTIEEEGTVNGMVNKVLKGFSDKMKAFADGGEDKLAKQNGQLHWVSDITSQ
ncbi:MAG: hypothetical protein K9I92_04115 [Chitinophagaceae bacterium]|jgi:hypothetical protein|nr:hypothetical protein [Chitinophagaceae bacterium]